MTRPPPISPLSPHAPSSHFSPTQFFLSQAKGVPPHPFPPPPAVGLSPGRDPGCDSSRPARLCPQHRRTLLHRERNSRARTHRSSLLRQAGHLFRVHGYLHLAVSRRDGRAHPALPVSCSGEKRSTGHREIPGGHVNLHLSFRKRCSRLLLLDLRPIWCGRLVLHF